jgi:hypothetical protein
MARSALRAVSLSQLLRQHRVVDALLGESEAPCLTPVSRSPLTQPTHLRLLPLKATPESLPGANTHTQAIRMGGCCVPQLTCALACRQRQPVGLHAMAGDRDLSGRHEGRGGRRLLDQERVVEIE